MTIDLSADWQILLSLAGAAVTASVPVLLRWLHKSLHLQAGSQAATDLDRALEHGVALVLDTVKSIAANNETVTVPAGVYGKAAELVAKLAPAAVSYLGITPGEIETLISARMAKAGHAVTTSPSIPVSTNAKA